MQEIDQLQQAIAALEAQRAILGDAVVEAALGPMREKLTALQATSISEQQRKLATVLFMDIVGHTALTHHLDPEELVDVIDRPLAKLADRVVEHGGRVVRFQGDGFKAVFGLPMANENDPENAILAGLAIQATADKLAVELETQYGLHGFAVRVGIATGLVLGGGVGTEGEDAVKGEPVNLAARLESAASPGGVLIAHSTYQHVRGVFDFQPLEPIRAKGFEDPVKVYNVLAAKPRSFRTRRRGIEGIETRMVGRDRELAQLQSLFSRLLEAEEGQYVTIVGEPGLGKSRLLYEFENWVDLQPARVRFFHGRSRLDTRRIPYGLLRDLFSVEFDIHDSDSEAVAIEKLEQGIAEVAASGNPDWAPFIGHMIGLNYTRNTLLQGILDDAQQIRDRAFSSAVQFFQKTLREQPVLILLEDIHWADEGSLDFLEYLMQNCLNNPLMIISLARHTLYEGHPSWGEEQNHVRIDLSPLSQTDSQLLVAEILRNLPEIPPEIHALITSQAEGVPYYVEEVIKMLIDDGVILTGLERWQVRKDKFIAGKIPPTLTGVLQARLDSLPGQERKVLNRASVVGRVFWGDLTARMKDPEEDGESAPNGDIDTVLVNLQDRELIFRKDHSIFSRTREFTFKHAVLRDVTYERLLKQIRRNYHLQVAEWLCEHIGERVGEYAGRIGEHYEQAGYPARAADWYARAGRQAQETYAPEMAMDYCRKALALWEQADELSAERRQWQMGVYNNLGQVLDWLGKYDEAIEAYGSLIAAAEELGDVIWQAGGWHGVAEAQMHQGDTRAAIDAASKEEELAIEAGAQLERIKARWMKAWGAFRLGEIETALALAEEVWQTSQNLGDRGQMAHSLNLLGVLESVSGRFDEAARYFQQALDIFNANGNRRRAMPLMNNLGVIREARGDYSGALERYRQALDTAREIGNRDGEMVYLSNVGGARVRLGKFAQAEEDLRQVIRMAGSGGLNVLSSTYSFLAGACLGQHKGAQALEAARLSLKLAEEMESQEELGIAWRALAQVAAFLGEPVEIEKQGKSERWTVGADECFAESDRIFQEVEREEERARTLREWANYKFERGEQEQGTQMWELAKEIFTELGAQPEVERMENRDEFQRIVHVE